MQNKLLYTPLAVAALLLAGCGENKQAQIERDRQRALAEEQAQKEIQKSNEAVNEVSKKLGRKPPSMDIGVPIEKKTVAPASTADTQTKK